MHSTYTVSSIISFSPPIFRYLEQEIAENNQFSERNVIGGILSKSNLWLANGPSFQVLKQNGNRIAAWTFGSLLKDPAAKVVCVRELQRPQGKTPLLIIAIDCCLTWGIICVFDIVSSKVLRTIQLKNRITNLHVVHNGYDICPLPGPLQCFDGILAVGLVGGDVFLLDICRQICDEVLSGTSLDEIRDELSPSEIIVLNSQDIENIEYHKSNTVNNGQHLAIHLNAIFKVNTPHFVLKGPEGDDRVHVNRVEVEVSALHYCPQLGSLLIGYNFGALQLWNLINMNLTYTSPIQEDHIPVSHFAILEPSDDPRACSYLWAIYSHTGPHQETFPIAVLYSFSFNSKELHEGYGYLYQDFTSASVCFEADLHLVDRRRIRSKPKGAYCTSVMALNKNNQANLTPETNEEPRSLCSIAWNVWCSEQEIFTYLSIFDINQWYKEQMPRMPDWNSCSSYMTQVCLSDLILTSNKKILPCLDICIKPSTISQFIGVQRLEEHYYSTSLTFECVCLRESDVSIIVNQGLQKTLLQHLEITGPLALVRPTEAYKRAITAGLIPIFIDVIDFTEVSIDFQREFLFNVALEQQLIGWLRKCALEWANGSYTSTNCSLDILLKWAWERAKTLKINADKLCVSLFDYSEIKLDANARNLLKNSSRQLKNVCSLFSFVLNGLHMYLPNLEVIEQQYETLSRISMYLEVLNWLLNVGLLPEGFYSTSVSNEEDQINAPYPFESLNQYYNDRRTTLNSLDVDGIAQNKSLLFIDNLVSIEFGQDLQKKWEENGGTGLYPPPSLQALLHTYLVENVDFNIKHCVVIYVFLDLAMTLDQNRYKPIITHLIKFPAVFKVSPSIIKITQAFWQLDHGDFTTAVDQLLDPLVSVQDLKPWHHHCVLHALLLQKQVNHALLYLQVRNPSIKSEKDVNLIISLYVGNNMLDEAFYFYNERKRYENDPKLLTHLLYECDKHKKLQEAVLHTFNSFEEKVLMKYLKDKEEHTTSDNLQVFYNMLRSRYFDAFYVDDKRQNSVVGEQGLVGKRKRELSEIVVKNYRELLPEVHKKLFEVCRKENVTLWKKLSKPEPMSVLIHNTDVNIKYKSTAVTASLSKAREIWTNNILNSPTQNDVIDKSLVEDTPFICTPKATSKTKRLLTPASQSKLINIEEDYEDEPSPKKRLKLTPRQSVTSEGKNNSTNNAIEHLTKLDTPIIKRRLIENSDSTQIDNICTPSSILKVHNLTKSISTPAASRGKSTTPENLDDIIDTEMDSVKNISPSQTRCSLGLTRRRLISRASNLMVTFDDTKNSSLSINNTTIENICQKDANKILDTSKNTSSSSDVFISAVTSLRDSTESNKNDNESDKIESEESVIKTKDESVDKPLLTPKSRRSYKKTLDSPVRSSPRLKNKLLENLTLESSTSDSVISKTSTTETRYTKTKVCKEVTKDLKEESIVVTKIEESDTFTSENNLNTSSRFTKHLHNESNEFSSRRIVEENDEVNKEQEENRETPKQHEESDLHKKLSITKRKSIRRKPSLTQHVLMKNTISKIHEDDASPYVLKVRGSRNTTQNTYLSEANKSDQMCSPHKGSKVSLSFFDSSSVLLVNQASGDSDSEKSEENIDDTKKGIKEDNVSMKCSPFKLPAIQEKTQTSSLTKGNVNETSINKTKSSDRRKSFKQQILVKNTSSDRASASDVSGIGSLFANQDVSESDLSSIMCSSYKGPSLSTSFFDSSVASSINKETDDSISDADIIKIEENVKDNKEDASIKHNPLLKSSPTVEEETKEKSVSFHHHEDSVQYLKTPTKKNVDEALDTKTKSSGKKRSSLSHQVLMKNTISKMHERDRTPSTAKVSASYKSSVATTSSQLFADEDVSESNLSSFKCCSYKGPSLPSSFFDSSVESLMDEEADDSITGANKTESKIEENVKDNKEGDNNQDVSIKHNTPLTTSSRVEKETKEKSTSLHHSGKKRPSLSQQVLMKNTISKIRDTDRSPLAASSPLFTVEDVGETDLSSFKCDSYKGPSLSPSFFDTSNVSMNASVDETHDSVDEDEVMKVQTEDSKVDNKETTNSKQLLAENKEDSMHKTSKKISTEKSKVPEDAMDDVSIKLNPEVPSVSYSEPKINLNEKNEANLDDSSNSNQFGVVDAKMNNFEVSADLNVDNEMQSDVHNLDEPNVRFSTEEEEVFIEEDNYEAEETPSGSSFEEDDPYDNVYIEEPSDEERNIEEPKRHLVEIIEIGSSSSSSSEENSTNSNSEYQEQYDEKNESNSSLCNENVVDISEDESFSEISESSSDVSYNHPLETIAEENSEEVQLESKLQDEQQLNTIHETEEIVEKTTQSNVIEHNLPSATTDFIKSTELNEKLDDIEVEKTSEMSIEDADAETVASKIKQDIQKPSTSSYSQEEVQMSSYQTETLMKDVEEKSASSKSIQKVIKESTEGAVAKINQDIQKPSISGYHSQEEVEMSSYQTKTLMKDVEEKSASSESIQKPTKESTEGAVAEINQDIQKPSTSSYHSQEEAQMSSYQTESLMEDVEEKSASSVSIQKPTKEFQTKTEDKETKNNEQPIEVDVLDELSESVSCNLLNETNVASMIRHEANNENVISTIGEQSTDVDILDKLSETDDDMMDVSNDKINKKEENNETENTTSANAEKIQETTDTGELNVSDEKIDKQDKKANLKKQESPIKFLNSSVRVTRSSSFRSSPIVLMERIQLPIKNVDSSVPKRGKKQTSDKEQTSSTKSSILKKSNVSTSSNTSKDLRKRSKSTEVNETIASVKVAAKRKTHTASASGIEETSSSARKVGSKTKALSVSGIEDYSTTRRLTRRQMKLLQNSASTKDVFGINVGDEGEEERGPVMEKIDPINLLDKTSFDGKPDPEEQHSPASSVTAGSIDTPPKESIELKVPSENLDLILSGRRRLRKNSVERSLTLSEPVKALPKKRTKKLYQEQDKSEAESVQSVASEPVRRRRTASESSGEIDDKISAKRKLKSNITLDKIIEENYASVSSANEIADKVPVRRKLRSNSTLDRIMEDKDVKNQSTASVSTANETKDVVPVKRKLRSNSTIDRMVEDEDDVKNQSTASISTANETKDIPIKHKLRRNSARSEITEEKNETVAKTSRGRKK